MIIRIIIMLIMATLTSCSLFSPVKITPANKYMVYTIPSNVPASTKKHKSGVILISRPEVQEIYNTNRMAYTISPFKVEYFGQNEWAENPGQMLQTLLVATLERTNRYRAVVTSPFSAHYDYMLMTQIERFHQRLCPGLPPAFEIVVRAQLINSKSNKVIISRVLTATVVHRYTTPYSAVFAANRAMEDILRQAAEMCRRH